MVWKGFSRWRLPWGQQQSRSRLKLISRYICLSVLTLLLTTIVVPAVAQHSLTGSIVRQASNAQTFLEEGKNRYQNGQFFEAVNEFQKAAQTYQTQNEPLNQALSLSYLSLAYQELGQWEEAQKAIAQSLELSQQAKDNNLILAKVLNAQGSLQLAKGHTQEALTSWQEAEERYKQAQDEVGRLGSQINQAQALQSLGFYRRSRSLLEQVRQQLQTQPDSSLKATGLRSLGTALQLLGDLQESKRVLEQSLTVTKNLSNREETSATLFNLGNITRALGDTQAAIEFYQQVSTTSANPLLKQEAQLNQLSLLIEDRRWSDVRLLLPQIQSELTTLTPSRSAIYAWVNFAENLMKLESVGGNGLSPLPELENSQTSDDTAKILAKAIQEARRLQDQRAESYALGTLGKLYEQKQQKTDAQNLTEQALQLAQTINANDIIYQWQWQLARILEARGDIRDAIAANQEAVNNLQLLRTDLVAINPDVQFSFSESVEPIYRNLVKLLLTSSTKTAKPSQNNLKQARDVIESLQQAELENFFREACLEARPKQIDEIDRAAAVIYPIILSDRLAVILAIPGQPLDYYETQLSQQKIDDTLEELFQSLNPAFSSTIRLQKSEQVYDWLIRPAQTTLEKNKITTLVFVLDGFLRNIPMTALYDGQKYLVENYRVAIAPGLQLLEPQILEKETFTAVTAGVSEENQGFAALPGVKVELSEIATEVPASLLLNQEFTRVRFERQIEETPAPVVHLATHGQFSSNPDETFVLAWDAPIKVQEFQNLLRSRQRGESNPIELLVMSACQTAAGDKQATLGLAGMAVRSGARSTIATLWAVKDESTALLMTEFYRELTETQLNKSEALRQAQISLLKSSKFQHPFYWAPFILVGNWL
ncbi:MAG: CHAT domain-containing protein [Hydrococcus sp. Prado102]|jgi:CHAT domain-containing protein|nr:CHAT domain-containing protein [Hydrococcus sp. Prado102]